MKSFDGLMDKVGCKLSISEIRALNKYLRENKSRYCNKCFQIKDLDDFSGGYCKECRRKYNRNNKGKYKEYQRRWEQENKEHRKGYQRRWEQENKERRKIQRREWYEENKEYIKEYNRKLEQKNKERRKIQKRENRKRPALASSYYNKLKKYYNKDDLRINDVGLIEVRCEYNKCRKWFIPNNEEVSHRLQAINGTLSSCSAEINFYCSDDCKHKCEKYGQKPSTLIRYDDIRSGRLDWIELNREVQPELRQLVLKRDNYTCQKCGNTEHLHCHHILPASIEPIESADIDNCITYCKECHKKAHMKDGCKYGQLRNCK